MATNDSKAPIRLVKRVQFGILAPDEIVSKILLKIPIHSCVFGDTILLQQRHFIYSDATKKQF